MTVQAVKAVGKKVAKTAAGAAAAGRESRNAYHERYDARAAERAAAREPGEPLLQPRDRAPARRRRTGGSGGGGRSRVVSAELGMRKGLGKSFAAATSGPKYVRILKAEFLLCMVILALSPLADNEGKEGVTDAFRRCAACMGLFFLLGLVASGGPGAAKASAAGGGLVTVALLVAQRNVFGAVASRITAKWPGAAGASVGGAAGNAAGDIIDAAQAQADAAAAQGDDDDGGGGATGGGGNMMNRVPDRGSNPRANWTLGPPSIDDPGR